MRPAASLSVLMALALGAFGCSRTDPEPVGVPRDLLTPLQLLRKLDPKDPRLPVTGEALLLWGHEPGQLRFPVERIAEVYGFSEDGARITYVEGADWILKDGGIRRTEGSAIPDFATYRYLPLRGCEQGFSVRKCLKTVICALGSRFCVAPGEGTFHFRPEPRNPPLVLSYFAYIDYVTRAPAMQLIAHRQGQAGAKLVACLGDSVAAGAQTVSDVSGKGWEDSWCGLLQARFPSTRFLNLAVGGADVGMAPSQIEAIPEHCDTAIVAFGMNDHMRGPRGQANFAKAIDATVTELLAKGIAVILVGFYEKNPLWLEAKPNSVSAYNREISNIAKRYNIPFIDVFQAFERLGFNGKNSIKVNADFMHHPNNYGQRIYYSLILPYFVGMDVNVHDEPAYVPGVAEERPVESEFTSGEVPAPPEEKRWLQEKE